MGVLVRRANLWECGLVAQRHPGLLTPGETAVAFTEARKAGGGRYAGSDARGEQQRICFREIDLLSRGAILDWTSGSIFAETGLSTVPAGHASNRETVTVCDTDPPRNENSQSPGQPQYSVLAGTVNTICSAP